MEKKLQVLRDQKGFTLLEILMVLLLIAILAAVGITAFVNYTKETKNASTKANLQILRNGIAAEYGKSQLDCQNTTPYWPCADMVQNNNITGASSDTHCYLHGNWTDPGTGGVANELCTTAQVPSLTDQQFANPGTGIPVNPWGQTLSASVTDCVTAGGTAANPGPAAGACARATDDCQGTAWTTNTAAAIKLRVGWCYDSSIGQIWANSNNNGWPTSPSTDNPEYSY